jgi:hypothetical protein
LELAPIEDRLHDISVRNRNFVRIFASENTLGELGGVATDQREAGNDAADGAGSEMGFRRDDDRTVGRFCD